MPLDSVLCTEELSRRPTRPPDHRNENRALVVLAQALADSPGTIFQALTDVILKLFKAGSAGISLLSKDETSFFWPAVSGQWQTHLGGGTPRDFGPCGDVLDRNAPLLFKGPERRYTYLQSAMPLAKECLLVPFYVQGKAVGTVWAVAHDDLREFDAEDLRQLESLGRFAAAAYQSQTIYALEQRRVELRLEEVMRSGQEMEKLNAELRVSEEALRSSEGDLRDFVENAAIGLHWVGPDGIILWANQTELDLVGYTREEYVGQHIGDVHADQPVIADILARLTNGETLHDYQARLCCKDGSLRHVLINSNAFFENGKLVHTRCFTRDITSSKQAETALRESEAFNRSIVESSPDCIKVLDLNGTLLSMQNGHALLGIEDIRPYLNKSWIEFWKGEDRQAAQKALEAATAGGQGQFVGFFRTLRGEPKWWDVAISPILDTSDKPVRLLAVSRDVSQRKRTEMNLAFLASVSQDLVRGTSVDDLVQTVGAKMAAYLDLSLSALVEIDEAADQVVIAHEWHREDVPGLAGVYRLADFVSAEFIRMAGAGETIVVRDTATNPLTDPEKLAALKIAAFVCVPLLQSGHWRFALCLYHSTAYDWREDEIELARELTARIWARMEGLRADAALHESEKRYRALFESIDEGYCVIEMIFDQQEKPIDWRFLEVNPSFARHNGLQDATGRRISELAPDLEAHWFETYGNVALTGEPIRFVDSSKALGGRWFDLYAFRVGGPDSRKVAVLFNNITERRRAEQELRESVEAMADLDRRKDEFLAMLGHELRNPLAPISNAVQLLRLQKDENPLQERARNVIERQVGQLTHLVDDLLEISRINSGRVQLRPERMVVSGIVERAVETAQPLILQRGHQLTVSLPPQPIWVHADGARLEQVLVNLLTNAAKYTDENGQIWLTVQQEGEAAVLRVRDTGIGIAPELLPRIFDLFTQAERSLDRSQGGLGIGLCLVQRMVGLHGGTVEAHSILGQGSEFVVRLPALRASLPPSPSPSIEPVEPPKQFCRVLVVDDNVDAAQSLAMLLELSGHAVRLAYDGPSAVEAALSYRPDLVLLDIGLPGLTGLEVAERLRQEPTLRNIVLVAMTGYGQETDRLRSQEAGFDHHLVKPAEFDEVQEILATVSKKATGAPSGSSTKPAARQ